MRPKKHFPKIRKFLRRTILQVLKTLGEDLDSVSLAGALERASKRGVKIGTVIDIGASDGRWSIACRKFFPDPIYFLIEAQLPHEPALQNLKPQFPNLSYLMAAAGDTEGEIYFDATDLLGGVAAHTPFEKNCIVVPVTTIDIQVKAKQLPPPYLIKLDTHGFEVPILSGASETLKQTALIVVEVYNFHFTPENLLFPEMTAHMQKLGFRPTDVCDPVHRQLDGMLWQLDMFFEPATNSGFSSTAFFKG